MKKLLKILRYALYLISGLALLAGLYLLVAIIVSKFSIEAESADDRDIDLYILTNGVHTDLVVPVATELIDWSEYLPFENTEGKDTSFKYLALGWGDKGFYLETPCWSDLKFRVAFNAAFGLSSAAIHATYYHQMPENESCVKMKMSKDQYQRLIEYVMAFLQLDENGKPIYIQTKANYGLNDAFYEAEGRYSFYYTCNSWANNALIACGQKASRWALSYNAIFQHYR